MEEVHQIILDMFEKNDQNGTGKIEFGVEFDGIMQDF